MSSKKGETKTIKLADVRHASVNLRDVTDKTSQKYKELVQSIKNRGILNQPSFTEEPDPLDPNKMVFFLVDGRQRTEAAIDAGLTEISGTVFPPMTDSERLGAQIEANSQGIDTLPVQYSKAMAQMLALDPTLTQKELAASLNKSESWIIERLKLPNLIPDAAKLTDQGNIVLKNAVQLSKMTEEDQKNFMDRAVSMSTSDFQNVVNDRLSELRKAKAAGRDPSEKAKFVLNSRLRSVTDLKAEVDNPANVIALCAKDNITAVSDVIKMSLKWALTIDPISASEKEKAFNDQLEADAKKKKDLADKRAASKAAALAAGTTVGATTAAVGS